MQFTHKLARRLALSRPLALAASLAVLGGCESDRMSELGPLDASSGSPVGAGTISGLAESSTILKRGGKYKITQVEVSPGAALLAPAAQQVFTATGRLRDGTTVPLAVKWNASGGSIDSTGLYHAPEKGGAFRVIATLGDGVADTATVAVSDTSSASMVQRLVLSPASASLQPNATQAFTTSALLSDGTTAPIQVTYRATGGTITPEGLYAAGQTTGSYRVIATASDGKADTSSVAVASAASVVQQVVLNPATLSLAPGGTQQFSTSAKMSDGSTTDVPVLYTATGGTISSGGVYTAGNTAGVYRAIATQQGGSLADTSTITIAVPSSAGTPADMADALVGTVSVQTHLGYNNVYQTGWSNIIRPRLLELGVRHIRERMNSSPNIISRFQDLGANGIKLTAGCWPQNGDYTDASQCIAQANAIGPSVIDAFDGWNEVDGGKAGPDWPTAWVQWETTLWQTYKANGTWASRPLYANSLAHAVSADQLGDRSAILDYGNMHSYPAAGLPSNVSSTWIPKWKEVAGSKPLVVTETGYHTCPTCTNGNGVSLLAQSKYLGRLVFEYFNRDVRRTNIYELIDQGVSTTDREKNWGLIKNDGSIKPAFTTLKNIIALLEDPGSTFPPGRLSYSLSGALPTTHQTLLQKRSGKFYLVLWQEVSVWNVSSKSDIRNPDDPVTLTLGTPASAIRVYRPSTGLSPIQSASGTSINLAVPDEVTVVEVTP
jgi:hypothetical protein